MARELTVARGIVLRETLTKETDKILTLLTEEYGRISVIAKRARQKGSRYAACAQPLAYGEWTLRRRGQWYYAHDGDTLELFQGLRGDLELLALGAYFAELAEAASVEELPSAPLLRHLLNGLYALSELGKPPELVKPVFELKLLCLAGYEPLLDSCAYCGRAEPENPVLDAAQGILRCGTCGAGGNTRSLPLCRDSLAAARRAVYGDEKRLYGFRLGGAALERLSLAAEAFLLTQFERRFRTLDYYRELRSATRAESGRASDSAPSPRYSAVSP